MQIKKIVVRIVLACIIISALEHWPDIKQGVVAGFNDGLSSASK
ncbi:hypothetical protein [Mucilaginibacter sp. dw_454]|nr:hypothetical protein [Mucilaginibacter sp. dw_454]